MENKTELTFTRTDWLIVGGLAALAIALRLIPGLRTIDDAYITYRYARNVATGVGFVYNAGEAVLGTTTPLYTLLLAGLAKLTGTAHQPDGYLIISYIVNALADGLTVTILYRITRRLLDHRLPAGLLGVLWSVAPRSVTFAIGGMETSVYILLITAAFERWLSGRTRLSAALTGLAVLTRPDALIWAGPLGLSMIWQAWQEDQHSPPFKRLPWIELGIFLAIVLPWVIYGTLTYGSPLTNSVAAKAVAYQLDPTQALITFMQQYATLFFEHVAIGPIGAMLGAIIYPLLAFIGVMKLFRQDWRSLPLTIFPWLHALVFIIANPLIFRWYSTPPLPFLMLSVMAGIWGVAAQIKGDTAARWVLGAAGVLWLVTSLNAWGLHPDHGPDRPAPEMAWFKLELVYEQAASSIAPEMTEGRVVAAADIGAVGWYTWAPLLDTLGLVSPVSSQYYPIPAEMLATTGYAVAPDLIADQQPDFIIILETYGRNSIMEDSRFAETYRLRERIETDIYGSDGMLIFERVEE